MPLLTLSRGACCTVLAFSIAIAPACDDDAGSGGGTSSEATGSTQSSSGSGGDDGSGGGGGGGGGAGGGGPIDPPVVCESQCVYVSPDAIGDGSGSDWTNAMTAIPAELTRGRVYLLADGDYGSLVIAASTNAGEEIMVRKATLEDHGTETGWTPDLGDGVAFFTGVDIGTSDVVFTGTRGGGPGAWTTGHGIEIERTGTQCADNGALIGIGAGVSNVAIRHVHAYAANYDYPMNGVKGTYGATNLTFAYNSIHRTFGPTFHIGDWSNIVIEHNHLADVRSTGAGDPFCSDWHAEGISSIGTNEDITIRFNIWDQIGGTAVIAGVNGGASERWSIYGNTFARSVTTIAYYNEPNTSNQQTMNDLLFYNNNVILMPGTSVGTLLVQAGGNNTAWNNIWYDNIANTFGFQGVDHDYNLFAENRRVEGCDPACDKDDEGAEGETSPQIGTGSPFIDATADPTTADLHLSAATVPGATLPDPFATDPDGVTRGGDGNWDRGVFEHAAD